MASYMVWLLAVLYVDCVLVFADICGLPTQWQWHCWRTEQQLLLVGC